MGINGLHHLKWDEQISQGFRDTNGSPNLGQTTKPRNSQEQQKKGTWRLIDFAIPTDYKVKLKEIEKRDKDIAKELKNYWTWHQL